MHTLGQEWKNSYVVLKMLLVITIIIKSAFGGPNTFQLVKSGGKMQEVIKYLPYVGRPQLCARSCFINPACRSFSHSLRRSICLLHNSWPSEVAPVDAVRYNLWKNVDRPLSYPSGESGGMSNCGLSCKNGGVCEVDAVGGERCLCPENYGGDLCETLLYCAGTMESSADRVFVDYQIYPNITRVDVPLYSTKPLTEPKLEVGGSVVINGNEECIVTAEMCSDGNALIQCSIANRVISCQCS